MTQILDLTDKSHYNYILYIQKAGEKIEQGNKKHERHLRKDPNETPRDEKYTGLGLVAD